MMPFTSQFMTEDQHQTASHFAELLKGELDLKGARRVFEGNEPYHAGTWSALSRNGWLGLITPEHLGGAALNLIDLCLPAYYVGYSIAPIPFHAHLCLATRALVEFGSDEIMDTWLPRMATGENLATFAFREEGRSDWRQTPGAVVKNGALSGHKVVVPYGCHADIVIVTAVEADSGETGLYLVKLGETGVEALASETLDFAAAYARLEFDQVPAQLLGVRPEALGTINKFIAEASIPFAFMQLGGAQACFDMARQYALDRYAFGRQIGSFQAIKHKLGRMFEALTIARANCNFATWTLNRGHNLLELAAASAMTATADAFNLCARENNKIHGGISATWDFDCHLYYRRARLDSLVLGNQYTWNKILTENLAANSSRLDINFSPDDEAELKALRAECRQWIADNAPPVTELYHYRDDQRFNVILSWHKRKAADGWACLHWPEQYGGRGWPPEKIAVFRQEEGEALRDLCFPLSIVDIAGAVLMEVGTEEQKERYLRKIYSGEEYWCQLFSEPHGGSDVGALRTRAEKDGDDWIINGQKIWTSNANYSDYGLLIARTDPTVAKHKGLTYFIMDMHAEGVTTQPLKQSTGDAGFCQVFFDNVRIPDSNRLGQVGDGWKIVMMTLANEKVALQLFQIYLEKLVLAISDLKVGDCNALEHPDVQRKLRDFNNRTWAIKFGELETMHKIRTAGQPGHEESVSKLIVAATNLDMASFVMELFDEQCFSDAASKSEQLRFFEYIYIHFVGVSMGGGTEEILLNLIGEQFLGLPPEPRVDKNVPFNRLPYGA